ncbi:MULTISPECIES: 4-hydroxyphenylacetate 3-monooxygenase, oxygenase component [unclassified Lysinibacillus]|uniref:4-hydroxyphenylacetate 3-monooxygenase, oxygenase component n=1 Tax=unclassified Lysinibacillus TaxID=2636778 RepID=UPI002010E56B|nr:MULTISPECIES: 4-hydroxyphenylacetate 3-monooxygenase, oxygenase component [unclassified Lysinibacillus]MCL1694973.1 4-hydroxyphenylacetate 3-monooxygenase, oxygenase component [Lysinibacillus sp. BPa_S21]MCL1701359.1 4-hydroxyphenylacetate 3-monooxygenase, oxygenase component [Lysinibacillus sp. Bpr_S20]
MPVITGQQYIDRIDALQTYISIDGKVVTGKVSEHPAFKGVMQSQARLFDLQNEKALLEKMTYVSPTSNKRVGMSFLQAETVEDLVKRRNATREWALSTHGLMGRSPDYMNTTLMALASVADYLKDKPNCFPQHLLKFYEYARENDLTMTHTFIEPQVNRKKFYFEDEDVTIAAKIVDKTSEGLVIKGARLLATQGGITDELLVISTNGFDEGKGFAFSIPSNTKGLKFLCRQSFVGGDSTFDYPLSSRYEEMDAIVVFDNVVVPWERVFYYENVEVANSFLNVSGFQTYGLHQVLTRQIAKTEFVLGVVQSIVNTINIGEYQHVQQKVVDIIVALETMKALLLKSEIEATRDAFGFIRPDFSTVQVAIQIYPKVYPTFTEIVQLLGASGLMSIPSEKAFTADDGDLEHYLQSFQDGGEERVKKFRLAWDLTMSSFGTRQTLYERFFFGDSVRLAGALYKNYNREEYVKRVEDFLKNNH